MPVFKKILESQRGGKILIDQEGYLYNYLRETAKGSTWACRAKYKLHCNSRVYYNESGDIEMDYTVGHNHPPKEGEARTIELLRKLKSGNSTKYSYKIKRELMKGLCEEDEELPTLLRKKPLKSIDTIHAVEVGGPVEQAVEELKRAAEELKRAAKEEVVVPVEPQEPDMEVDVDSNPLNISSTQEVEDSFDPDQALQQVLQQLLHEPELLRSVVDSLTDSEREVLTSLTSQGSGLSSTIAPPPPPQQLPPSSVVLTPALSNQFLSAASLPALLASSSQQFNSTPHLISTASPRFIATSAPQIVMASSGHFLATSAAQVVAPRRDDQGIAYSCAPISLSQTTAGSHHSTQAVAGSSNRTIMSLPETIISNQMVYKRLPGDAIYFAPPALKNPYCRQCTKSFTSEAELDQHFEALQCCELCKIAFCVPEHYTKHNELNHPDGLKSAWGTLCETCGRVFGVSFQLDSHRAKCSNRLSLRCPRCFFSFGFEEDLKRHKKLHSGLPNLKCTDCMREFPTEIGLQTHKARRIQNKGPFNCLLCGKVFCLRCDFAKHIKSHLEEGADPMVCKFCTQMFCSSAELLSHEAKHLDISICKFCGVQCNSTKELMRHEKTHLGTVQMVQNSALQGSGQQNNTEPGFMRGVVNEMESLINSL